MPAAGRATEHDFDTFVSVTCLFQGVPQGVVIVFLVRVEVISEGGIEERRVLRDDGDAASQLVEAQLADVNAVNSDGSFRFSKAE